jgi:hypothetical protein
VTGHSDQGRLRIGLDLGGSKIEGILLSREATELARYRIAVSGDGACNSRTDKEAHRPPPHNKPAAAAHNKQAAVVERHTPLAV